MPRIQPSQTEEASRVVRSCISGNMDLYHLDEELVSAKLGITTRTLRNKRDRPETFTVSELWKLGKALKMTPIQAASIVLGRPLTSREVKEFLML